MTLDLTGLTGDVIYKYGTYIFIFWIATFLVRKMWDLFEGRLKNIDDNVAKDLATNTENKKINKDILVIQAQISEKQAKIADKLVEHDNCSKDTWKEVFAMFRQLTEFFNGSNPKIAEMQKEIDKLKDNVQKKA